MKRNSLAIMVALLILGFATALGQSEQQGGNQDQPSGSVDGAQVFQQCSTCHGGDGEGDSGPALAGNDELQNAEQMIDTILNGRGAMPAWRDSLSDEEIAAVATHERASWGNDFGEISADQVARQRSQSGGQAGQQGSSGAQADGLRTRETEEFGSILATDDGRFLFLFVNDAPEGTSHCYDPCTTHWQPLMAGGDGNLPVTGDDLDTSMFTTVQRDDGTNQVAYRGWPLYAYADAQGGEQQEQQQGQDQQVQDQANPAGIPGQGITDLFRLVAVGVEAIATEGPQTAQQEQQQDQDEAGGQQTAEQQGESGSLTVTVNPADAIISVIGADGFTWLADVNGSQTLESLPAGTYLVTATASGHELMQAQTEIQAGQQAEVSLTLQESSDRQAVQEQGLQAADQQDQGQQQEQQGQDQEQQQGQQEQAGQEGSVDGAQVYTEAGCHSCHGQNGEGGTGPALAGNQNLQDAQAMIQQILNGGGGMPAFSDQLSAAEVAAVATHERSSWGNDFGEITADQVEQAQGGGEGQ